MGTRHVRLPMLQAAAQSLFAWMSIHPEGSNAHSLP